MSRGWAKALACRLQVSQACVVLCQIVSPSICPGRLHTAWLSPLSSFHVLWSPSGDMRGPSVVSEAVDMPCLGPFHFSDIAGYRLVFLSLYMILSILPYILVCAPASFFCAYLVSVNLSASYIITGSTQELYTCLFRQMARLLLKISRCLAYDSSLYLFVLVLLKMLYQHIVHVCWVLSLRFSS